MSNKSKDWLIFKGEGEPHTNIKNIPPPPPWRGLKSANTTSALTKLANKINTYIIDDEVVELINAAIYLRRPILVTGAPGTGKSSLTNAIAYELSLEPVIKWSITSQSSLKDGLYRYDAIARLQDASTANNLSNKKDNIVERDLPTSFSKYLRLGPLGSALASSKKNKPRILLIDELDKGDIDLPNNLLNIFEDNEFEIPELSRLADDGPHSISLYQEATKEEIEKNGKVECEEFPIVIMTSNGERVFPPAFLRRCIQIQLEQPDEEKLHKIIESHFEKIPSENKKEIEECIIKFVEKQDKDLLATDQLMNAVYLILHKKSSLIDKDELLDALWMSLDN